MQLSGEVVHERHIGLHGKHEVPDKYDPTAHSEHCLVLVLLQVMQFLAHFKQEFELGSRVKPSIQLEQLPVEQSMHDTVQGVNTPFLKFPPSSSVLPIF